MVRDRQNGVRPMNRLVSLLCVGVFCLVRPAIAQPMTPSEAKAAYENAVRSPELLPGSYREVSTRQTPRGATLTTTISTLPCSSVACMAFSNRFHTICLMASLLAR